MSTARYDANAEFYERAWPDNYDDNVSVALFTHIGDVRGRNVLDVACGHGRITRELARRGCRVVGIDVSDAMVQRARAREREHPPAIEYLIADVADTRVLAGRLFDVAVCSFGLTDIDDLDAALATIAGVLVTDGKFVFSMLHPCFAGGISVAGSWPSGASYLDEGHWIPSGAAASSLRARVGSTHRTLSTYVTALADVGLRIAALSEPPPSPEWKRDHPEAASLPVFLVATASR